MDENKVYDITLSDGTTLTALKMNGNNFISTKKVTAATFDGKLSPVTISDGENTEEHPAMDLIHVTKMGKEYWFALRDLTSAELADMKLRSDVDYIALMCDVDL